MKLHNPLKWREGGNRNSKFQVILGNQENKLHCIKRRLGKLQEEMTENSMELSVDLRLKQNWEWRWTNNKRNSLSSDIYSITCVLCYNKVNISNANKEIRTINRYKYDDYRTKIQIVLDTNKHYKEFLKYHRERNMRNIMSTIITHKVIWHKWKQALLTY